MGESRTILRFLPWETGMEITVGGAGLKTKMTVSLFSKIVLIPCFFH